MLSKTRGGETNLPLTLWHNRAKKAIARRWNRASGAVDGRPADCEKAIHGLFPEVDQETAEGW